MMGFMISAMYFCVAMVLTLFMLFIFIVAMEWVEKKCRTMYESRQSRKSGRFGRY